MINSSDDTLNRLKIFRRVYDMTGISFTVKETERYEADILRNPFNAKAVDCITPRRIQLYELKVICDERQLAAFASILNDGLRPRSSYAAVEAYDNLLLMKRMAGE
jgi:hypothetical protein